MRMFYKSRILSSLAFTVAVFAMPLCGYSAAAVKGVELVERFSKDTVVIGDQFELWLDLKKDMGQQIQIPTFEADAASGAGGETVGRAMIGGKLELLSAPVIDTLKAEGRMQELRVRYPLTVFEAGVYRVPSLGIVYSQANVVDTVFSADSLTLVVTSFEIDTTTMKIADIKGPIAAPLQWREVDQYVYIALAVVAVVGLLVWLYFRYWRRRGAMRKAVPVPLSVTAPDVWALSELDLLEQMSLWQAGKYKEYFSRLSDVLRQYVEGRFGVQAMEMTTPEIVGALSSPSSSSSSSTSPEGRNVEKLRVMLMEADMVKFAKYTPDADACQDALIAARKWVSDTTFASKSMSTSKSTSTSSSSELTIDNN